MREREKLIKDFFLCKIKDTKSRIKIRLPSIPHAKVSTANRMCVEENHDKIATLRRGTESLILSSDDHFFIPFFSASAVNLSCITRDIASSF